MDSNETISTTETSFTPITPISGTEEVENASGKPRKVPKRVLHFSDGVMEEFSSDEDDQTDSSDEKKAVDTKKLSWPQYVLYATMAFGNGTLKACDYVGEGLASFFGITTPKYQYEINEHERMVKEQEEAKKKEDSEMQGWRENQNDAPDVVSSGPAAMLSSESETQHPQRY